MSDFDMTLSIEKVDLKRGIGSEFWLPPSNISEKPIHEFNQILPDSKIKFVTTGREALYQIIKSLKIAKEENILVPAYLDWTVIDPFIRTSTKIRFYKIKNNLEIDSNDIHEKINGKTKAILIIHYFGFPQPLTEIKKLKAKCLIIEDTTHSLLSVYENKPSGSLGDISYAGFRKLLPIPDCALICYNNKNISIPELSEQDLGHLAYREKRESGLYYAGNFIRSGNEFQKKLSQNYFEIAEELIQLNYRAMHFNDVHTIYCVFSVFYL